MKAQMLFGALLAFFMGGHTANATSLYMDPSVVAIERGDTVKVSVRLDTSPDECVNVIDGVITYSDQIKLVDVSRGQSILSMWVEEPNIDTKNNQVSFAGGIPNGYCGRVAGDPRLTNVVLDLIFQAPGFVIGASENATATVAFSKQTKVLLNDGYGTPSDVQLYGAQLTLLENKGGVRDAWGEIVTNDVIAPEKFSISLERTPNAFSNRYFITFNTSDKQSGIDHYEVIEEPSSEKTVFTWGSENAPWRTTVSPYQLKDQTLHSTIRVRAVDKAGNEYVATLIPDESQRTMGTQMKVLIAIIGTVLFACIFSGALYVYLQYRKKKKQKITETSEIDDEDLEDEEDKQ